DARARDSARGGRMTRWTTGQLAEHLTRVKAPPPPAIERPGPKFKSKLEAEYAQMLEAPRAAGQIRDWHYEGITIKLADGVRFTVDFNIIGHDGSLSMVETKGFMREAARVRLAVAARMYPMWSWFLVRKVKGAFIVEAVHG